MRRVLILGMLLLPIQASAHDPGGKFAQANPKMHEWFEGLRSGKGPCCSDADGNVVKDSDWEAVNDPAKPNVHYRVFIQEQWVDVPDDAVLTQPNMYGRTMVWPFYNSAYGGPVQVNIRCFIPGPGI